MKVLIFVLIVSFILGGSARRGPALRRHPWVVFAGCACVGVLYLSASVIG